MTTVLLVGLAVACSKKDDADKSSGSAAHKGDLGAKHGGIPTSREGQMFLLGEKLSQAAMLNGLGSPDLVARTYKAASLVAKVTLKTELAPLPVPTGDNARDGAAGMHYLLKQQGADLGRQISTSFGETSAATYELAVKINMLPRLYTDDPAHKMADTMADVFARVSARAKLPPSAMAPIIAKLKARAPVKEVSDMALALNKSLPVTIAEIYEKERPKQR